MAYISNAVNSLLGSWGNSNATNSTSATSISQAQLSGGTMLGAAPIPPHYATTGTTLFHSNGATQSQYANDLDVFKKLDYLKGYVEMCGDKLEYVYMDKMMETKDSKISVLKLANVGDFIKNVGLRYSDDIYYIIREKE